MRKSIQNRGLIPQAITGLAWLGGGAIAALVIAAPMQAATLNSWRFDPSTQQLVITLPKHVTPQYYIAAEPARIIIDLPDVDVGTVPTQQTYGGAVRQIRIAQFQPGLARIVLELSPEAVLAPKQVELQQHDATADTQQWTLRPLLIADANQPASSPNLIQSPASAPAPTAAATASLNSTANSIATNSTVTTPAAASPANPVSSTAEASPTAAYPAPNSTPAASINSAAIPAEPRPTNPAPARSTASVAPAPSSNSTRMANAAANPSRLPPLEPGAVEIPVEMPSTASRSAASSPSTAVASAPLPVDFAKPLSERPAGTAAALTVPSVQAAQNSSTAPQTAQSPNQSSDSLSFPTPTAEAVRVPGISTIAPVEPPQPTGSRTRRTRSAPTASAPHQEVKQPTLPPPTAAPTTASAVPAPAVSAPAAASPQPFPVQSPTSTSMADNAIRFGQPIPTPSTPNQVNPQNSQLPRPNSPNVGIIQFGQPLPGQPSS